MLFAQSGDSWSFSFPLCMSFASFSPLRRLEVEGHSVWRCASNHRSKISMAVRTWGRGTCCYPAEPEQQGSSLHFCVRSTYFMIKVFKKSITTTQQLNKWERDKGSFPQIKNLINIH